MRPRVAAGVRGEHAADAVTAGGQRHDRDGCHGHDQQHDDQTAPHS